MIATLLTAMFFFPLLHIVKKDCASCTAIGAFLIILNSIKYNNFSHGISVNCLSNDEQIF